MKSTKMDYDELDARIQWQKLGIVSGCTIRETLQVSCVVYNPFASFFWGGGPLTHCRLRGAYCPLGTAETAERGMTKGFFYIRETVMFVMFKNK